jgi:hypothetical protein
MDANQINATALDLLAAADSLDADAALVEAGEQEPAEVYAGYERVLELRKALLALEITAKPAGYTALLTLAGNALNRADDAHKAKTGEYVPFYA